MILVLNHLQLLNGNRAFEVKYRMNIMIYLIRTYGLVLLMLFSFAGVLAQKNSTYIVKKGETLQSIAKEKRLSVADILRLNPDVRREVSEGVILILPQSEITHFNGSETTSFSTHVVKKQETLFDLARRYHISMDDIKRYNQVLYNRDLQVGDSLTIPVFKISNELVSADALQLKTYVVQPHEGLWRIARNHGVSVEALLEVNPDLTQGVKQGQRIWIPSKPQQRSTSDAIDRKYALYTTEKAEGFYSLKRKFGLSEQELIALNPELENGIKVNTEIRIPVQNYKKYIETLNVKDRSEQEHWVSSKVVRIAYVLPFRVNDATEEDQIKERLQSDKLTQIATDFYLGAQMALDTLYRKGYRFDVEVFDSASKQDIDKLIDSHFDAIIGAFSPKTTNMISQNVASTTMIFAPLSNGKDLHLRSNVFQTLPSVQMQKQTMINYISSHFENENILLLSDMQNNSDNILIESRFPQIRVIPNNKKETIETFLQRHRANIIIINTREITYLIKALQSLSSIVSQHKFETIRLITLDKTPIFDNNNVSVQQLSQLHFTFASPNRFSNRDTSFLVEFEKVFGVIPNRYIIRGYDITTDVVQRLSQPNANFEQENMLIENIFSYKPNSYFGGGWENNGVYILEYNNLKINELK